MKVVEVRRGDMHVWFRIDDRRVPAEDVEWFSEWIRIDLSLERIRGGSTIQVGWMINRFDEGNDGLHIVEPDFESVPIVFIDSVTRTLVDLRRQKDVAESVRLAPEFPSIRESGWGCTKMRGSASEFIMHRSAGGGAGSGWFVGCTDIAHDHDDEANLVLDSLYALAVKQPRITPFLALPPGCAIEKYDDEVSIYKDDRTLSIEEGSFLDRQLRR